MRWLRWPTSILLSLLIPVLILLLIPKLNNFGPDALKNQLKEHNAYEQLSTLLHQDSDQPEPGEAQVTDQALVVLRSALTTDYIENKANQVIDDSAAWLNNETDSAPVLNLNDIKDQVLTAYPDAQIQLNQLTADLAEAQQQLEQHPEPVDGIEGLNADGSASTSEIAKLLQSSESLDNFINGDFRLNLSQALNPLHQAYQYYQLTIPILGGIIVLLLIGFVLSSTDWPSKLKNLGWLLIIISTINGILSVIFSVLILKIGLDMVIGMLPNQAEVAGSIGQATLQSLFADYIQIEAIITVIMFVIGLALVIGTKIYNRRSITTTDTQAQPATTLSEAEPGKNSQQVKQNTTA